MVLGVVAWLSPARATADEAAPTHRLTCPLDGTQALPLGGDGRPSPKTYSDLEVPTEAYTNLVVACPKCGYAGWAQDFQTQPGSEIAGFVRSQLAPTAKRAGTEAIWAFKHFLRILEFRRAPVRERLGATLFYSYVLKRKRPNGGQDPDMERELQGVRRVIIEQLREAMRVDPPKKARGQLEWQYLLGELTRLVGEAKKAEPLLRAVCSEREEAGYQVGRMACDMATRANHGETFEDYREGVFDIAALPPPGAKKPAPAEPAKPKEPEAKAPETQKPLPPMERPPPPRGTGDAPPPPPPASADPPK